jgi:hypothetical protein
MSMNQFSFRGAWSKGVGLFSGAAGGHALILIGLGILVPFALQYALVGGPLGLMNPAAAAGAAGMAGMGAIAVVAMVAGYILQMGSYFGSLRLGLEKSRNVAGAVIYGLIAGLAAVVGLGLVFGAVAVGLTWLLSTLAFPLILVLAFLLAAAFYAWAAALVAVALFLILVLAMVLGASTGQIGAAATLVGGDGSVAVIVLFLMVVLLWLTARYGCTTAVMADRRIFNPFAAMRESWRLTADDQFSIMGYLALMGLVLSVIIFVSIVVAGLALASVFQLGDSAADIGLAGMILVIVMGIPFAYLTVIVPGGIYRQITGSYDSADIFA